MNSLTKMEDQIFIIFDDKELIDEGKCKIIAKLQDRFGFLVHKFKKVGHPPASVLPADPALPLSAPDEHDGDGPAAAVVEGETEGYFSHHESGEAEDGNASTETLLPARSLKDLSTFSNA